jgi:hypothetical protein
MYLKKTNKPNGRTYLSIVESKRDGKSKHSKTVNVKSLGYLDELAKEHADPIAHCMEIIGKMNRE